MKFYRVCNDKTKQGLWYDFTGGFTGLIHNDFKFCLNNELRMDFDKELVGWLSAVDSLDDLFNWFSKDDVIKLQEFGWSIHEYESESYKMYEKFNHIVIDKSKSSVIRVIKL